MLDVPRERQPDRWFNPGLVPATERLRQVIATVLAAVEHGAYKRALKPLERESLHKVLTVLIANLGQHLLTGGVGGIPVPRAKRALGVRATRYDPFVFPLPFPRWLDSLEALGFIKQRKGVHSNFPGRSTRTTVNAGGSLISLIREHNVTLEDIRDDGSAEIIILGRSKSGWWDDDPGKRREEYQDTPETLSFRRELEVINAWLERADIQFDVGDYRNYIEALRHEANERDFRASRVSQGR